MKFSKLVKRLYLSIILLLSVVTIIPLIFITCDIADEGYEHSFLNKIIKQLEN